jgi:hypothetical protein
MYALNRSLHFLLFLLIGFICLGQENNPIFDRRGKFIIEPNVGIPNAGNFILYSANKFDSDDVLHKTTNTSAPLQIGIRLEYMLTARMGMSFETNYEKSGFKTETKEILFDPFTGHNKEGVNVTEWSQEKTRFLARFHYHFFQSKYLDIYSGMGIGATYLEEKNPKNQIDEYDTPLFPVLILDRSTNPLSMRICMGTRIFFTKKIGMLFELGLGAGSIFNLGATICL